MDDNVKTRCSFTRYCISIVSKEVDISDLEVRPWKLQLMAACRFMLP